MKAARKEYGSAAADGRWPPKSDHYIENPNMTVREVADLDVFDPIVHRVMQRMVDRSDVGMKKYGVSMMRDDVSTIQWIDHAIEEALDFAVYMERIKDDLMKGKQHNG